MDSTAKFWGYFWLAMFAIFMCAVTTWVAINRVSDNEEKRILAEMVKAGADPIAARCGMDGVYGGANQPQACITLAQRMVK
ncbi:hypothetical protein [Pseudescherichia sp.]|uniref:hypothetical protein n=1 Tax=Pseudescherichia sp. TaxID=2055881 RepID=UPI0028A6277D|nr:hypothetical protein [Pseudescherichia sp.]